MADRPTTARIPVNHEPDERATELLQQTLLRDGQPINIFGTLAHHPALLKQFNRMGGQLLRRGLVPGREREIVILRVGANARSRYEFGQHVLIGRDEGLTDAEIEAIRTGAIGTDTTPHPWSADDLALLALADDLHTDDCVTDETFAALRRRWNDAELVELLVLAGFYRLVSGFLNSAGVELDDGVPEVDFGLSADQPE